ncbi:MAG: lipopolysaccharide biosynthesis protein [Xanthobacteraceae bacterium]|nr:lipopolysaccharide biosynthesis protein [Xanthobacteraceae bacterium]
MTRPSGPSDLLVLASRWAVLSVIVQAVKVILLFGSQLVLARYLSPADFGIVAMCAPVFGFLAIFNDLGLSQATVQRPVLTEDDSSVIFWINVAIGVAISILIVLIAPGVASFYGDSRITEVLTAMSCLIIINSVSSQQVALMFRRMRPVPLLLIDIVPVVANATAAIGAAVLDYGYWAIVIGQAAHAFTAGSLAWIMSDFRPGRPRSIKNARPILQFGIHLTSLSIASIFVTNLSPVIVGRFFGVIQVGLFDRGYKLVAMSYIQILTPISRIAETLLARLATDEDRYRRAFLQLAEAVLLVLLPGIVCLAIMSDAAVELLYGIRWRDSSPLVAWFSLASLMTPLGAVASWLFVSQGRTAQMLRFGLVGNALSVVSLFVGLSWGPVGVAVSAAAFSVPIQGLAVWGATREGPVALGDLTRAIFPLLLAAAASGLAVYASRVALRGLSLAPVLQLSVGVLAAYVTALLILSCFHSGRRILRDANRVRQIFQNRRAAESI